MEEKDWVVQIIIWIKENKKSKFEEIIDEFQPYDIRSIFKELPNKHKNNFLQFLGNKRVIDLIQELDNEDRLDVLERLPIGILGYVLDKMDKDDLAVLLESLSVERATELMNKMNQEESKTVQTILTYPSETAGRIMTDKYIWVSKDSRVKDAFEKMKQYASFSETINYLYVIDENKRLVGVVSHRDLILSNQEDKIADIMFNRVISVDVLTDQEKVAHIIEQYDFLALPVVNEKEVLLGIITIDDAMDVLIKEATEDIEKFSASGKDIDFDTRAIVATAKRLPWLIMLLFIGMVTGGIINRFESTIQQVIALTYFMPMIAGMTGNTGTQSLAITIRGLSHYRSGDSGIWKLIKRELLVGIYIGTVCSGIIFLIGYVWQDNWMFGFVVGLSLFVTLIIGTLAGTIIPITLHKCQVDPAVASGPLITSLNDIFSLLVYFGLASLFIHALL